MSEFFNEHGDLIDPDGLAKFQKVVREREAFCVRKWEKTYENYATDWNFRSGDQWNNSIKQSRKSLNKSNLIINKIKTDIGLVQGEQLHARQMMKLVPLDDDSAIPMKQYFSALNETQDPEEAAKQGKQAAEAESGQFKVTVSQILEQMLRDVEKVSNAQTHYDEAFENMLVGGVGWLKVSAKYNSPHSKYRDIAIESIYDSRRVLVDPNSNDPMYQDMEYAFVKDYITLGKLKRMYPQAYENLKSRTFADLRSISSDTGGGMTEGGSQAVISEQKENAMVAIYDYYTLQQHYYAFEPTEAADGYRKSYVGSVADLENEDAAIKAYLESLGSLEGTAGTPNKGNALPKGVVIRILNLPYKQKLVEFTPITKNTRQFGYSIPLVPMLGTKGKLNLTKDVKNSESEDECFVYEGMVRHSVDSQKMINYITSYIADRLRAALGEKIAISDVALQGNEKHYKPGNLRNSTVLPFSDEAKHPPSLIPGSPNLSADLATLSSLYAAMDEISGVSDARSGQQSNERSSVAIQTRADRSRLTSAGFMANYQKSLKAVAQVVLNFIPDVYNHQKMVRLVVSGKEVKLWAKHGIDDLLKDNSNLRFDFEMVSTDAMNMRDEQLKSFLDILQTSPELSMLLAPDIVRAMNFNKSDETADKITKMLAIAQPALVSDDDKARLGITPPPPTPQEEIQMEELKNKGTKSKADAVTAAAKAQVAVAELGNLTDEDQRVAEKVIQIIAQVATEGGLGAVATNLEKQKKPAQSK